MTDIPEVTEALDDDYAHDSFQFDLVMLSNGAALTMHKDPEAIQRADRIREYVGSLSELPIRDKSAEGRFLKAMALNCGSNVPCSECGCDLYDDFKRLVASYDSRQRRLASLRSQHSRDEAEPCEGCGKPSVTSDIEGVPLCASCLANTVEENVRAECAAVEADVREAVVLLDQWLDGEVSNTVDYWRLNAFLIRVRPTLSAREEAGQ